MPLPMVSVWGGRHVVCVGLYSVESRDREPAKPHTAVNVSALSESRSVLREPTVVGASHNVHCCPWTDSPWVGLSQRSPWATRLCASLETRPSRISSRGPAEHQRSLPPRTISGLHGPPAGLGAKCVRVPCAISCQPRRRRPARCVCLCDVCGCVRHQQSEPGGV